MKKIISLLLAIVVSVSLFVFGGCTKEYDNLVDDPVDIEDFSNDLYSNIGGEMLQYPSSNNDFEYNAYETYVEITWYTGFMTDVIIPDKIEGLPVKVIGPYAFDQCRPEYSEKSNKWIAGNTYLSSRGESSEKFALTSVVLPQYLVEIGKHAFFDHALTELLIPDSVEIIGEDAFNNCRLLSNVVFGSSVREIKEGAFFDCNLKGSIVLPDGLTTIGKSAFDIYEGYDSGDGECYNNIEYYRTDSSEGAAKLRGETVYGYVIYENFEYTKKYLDLTKIELFDSGDAIIVVPASVIEIGEYAFDDDYTIKTPKGSAAVQYVTNNRHPLYEIY